MNTWSGWSLLTFHTCRGFAQEHFAIRANSAVGLLGKAWELDNYPGSWLVGLELRRFEVFDLVMKFDVCHKGTLDHLGFGERTGAPTHSSSHWLGRERVAAGTRLQELEVLGHMKLQEAAEDTLVDMGCS